MLYACTVSACLYTFRTKHALSFLHILTANLEYLIFDLCNIDRGFSEVGNDPKYKV
jgi:hypothetical protein